MRSKSFRQKIKNENLRISLLSLFFFARFFLRTFAKNERLWVTNVINSTVKIELVRREEMRHDKREEREKRREKGRTVSVSCFYLNHVSINNQPIEAHLYTPTRATTRTQVLPRLGDRYVGSRKERRVSGKGTEKVLCTF